MSQKLGHCDIFFYKSLIKVLYNNHEQFYILLLVVIPKNSVLFKINVIHMFHQNTEFFRFSYTAQADTSYFFLSNNLIHHPC